MVTIKSKHEIEKMRRAARVVAETLLRVKEMIEPGVSTLDLDQAAEEFIRAQGMTPSFKGYLGYQHTLCTSVNEEVVHGIPSARRVLKAGDIIGVDCGAIFEGYHGDSARTFAVGSIGAEEGRLLEITQQALEKGIAEMVPGQRLYDIGAAIQEIVESQGLSVVREYVGHGIGTKLHEDPQIPNYGKRGTGMRLKAGMVFAIEPMVNLGTEQTRVLEDGWTVVTQDGKFSAHFEDTAIITENGPEILTRI